MIKTKYKYYEALDLKSEVLAKDLTQGKNISEEIMKFIVKLYESANVEKKFKDDSFSSAYHSPVTSELEFFIARILFHFSAMNKLEWRICLRNQVFAKETKKRIVSVPDIRIEKEGKTIAIIEIKAKGGWIQSFFSEDRLKYDKERFDKSRSEFNPDKFLKEAKERIVKCKKVFKVSSDRIFFLLPTLTHVHRKNYRRELADYYSYFKKTSGLPKTNLILLSRDLFLNLSGAEDGISMEPTSDFERMIKRIKRL